MEYSEERSRLDSPRPIDFPNNNEDILDLCVRRCENENYVFPLIEKMECRSPNPSPPSSPLQIESPESRHTSPQSYQTSSSTLYSSSSAPVTVQYFPPSLPPSTNILSTPLTMPSVPNEPVFIPHHPMMVTQTPVIVTQTPVVVTQAPQAKSLLQQQLQQPPNFMNAIKMEQPQENSQTNANLLVGIQSSLYSPFPPIMNGNNRSVKPKRPFKAYPKDPLRLAAGVSATEALLGCTSNAAYVEFRQKMLDQIRLARFAPKQNNNRSNSEKISISPRQPSSTENEEMSGKDAAYRERRRKNNESAKRSRDARRAKEDEIAIRVAFLEQENLKLKYEVAALRTETTQLKFKLYNRLRN